MNTDRRYREQPTREHGGNGSASSVAPGKTTLTEQIQPNASNVPVQVGAEPGPSSVPESSVDRVAGSSSSLPSSTSIHRLFGPPDASGVNTRVDGPAVSGLVSREARDGNGVVEGAEDAVATASSSSGSALPDALLPKFENSLGADLSSVRVHTGAESAAAADAVGARAYTMGQDIHFGAGQYDPSSAGGERLLAHEVAHTVQQGTGAPTRQNKLEVSSPDDPFEHEADGAAHAMVAGAPFAISRGSASAARAIARERKWEFGAGAKATPIGDGFVKFQVEGSAKVEQSFAALTISGQVSAGGEAEVKWKPDSKGGNVSVKETKSSGGKKAQQWEEEVPVWKATATQALKEDAERHLEDHFTPVEAHLVFGADASDKPGDDAKQKPGEKKGSVSVGIKCKTKSNDNFTVKVQFFEIQKKGEVTDVVGPALKANYDKKFKSKPLDVKVGDTPAKMTVTGNIKPEISFKPNWAWIAEQIAKNATADAAAVAVEAAVVAGPPFLAALIMAHGIYIAGEKGQRDAAILEGAKDANRAAMVYAQIMTGVVDFPADGPRSQAAAAKANAELAGIAASNKMTVEQLRTDLRQRAPSDYMRIYGPARQQAHIAYSGEVSKAITAWRKEHWFAAMWTQHQDDVDAVMKLVEMVWQVR
jgi:hypothetical protein